MKTTLDIEDELLAAAKATAARERKTLTRLIEEGLNLRLRKAAPPRRPYRKPVLPVYRGVGGLAAGIDATRNRSLFDAADS